MKRTACAPIAGARCGALVAGLGLLIGCGREGTSPGGATAVRDSAGIRIVENGTPNWAEGAGWTVADTPSVDIGGGRRGPAYELARVVGLARLADGRIAVANGVTGEIRFFDATGEHVGTSGRQGSGPGEYQSLTGFWSGAGDSLLIADIRSQRLTVLDGKGTLGRSFSLGGVSGLSPTQGRMSLAIPSGWFADGSVLGMQQPFRINDPREGSFRDTVTLVRYGPDGTARDTVARYPGIEMEMMPLTFGGQTVASPNPMPLGRQTVLAVAGDRVYAATNEGWEVQERGANGALRSLIRVRAKTVPVSKEDIATHRQEQIEMMAGVPELRSVPKELKDQIINRVNSAKYPETFPWIASLLAGHDGALWVEEVVRPGEERRQFAVLDSTGVLLGRVRMPPKFRPLVIGTAEVLGVWTDADDVEHVRAYGLRR